MTSIAKTAYIGKKKATVLDGAYLQTNSRGPIGYSQLRITKQHGMMELIALHTTKHEITN